MKRAPKQARFLEPDVKTPMKRQWTPPNGVFRLETPEPLKTLKVPTGNWLGIYQGPNPDGELLYASRSALDLYSTLSRSRFRRGKAIRWPVSVRCVNSQQALTQRIPAGPRDGFRRMRQDAFRAIAEARNRIENKHRLYTEAQMKEARQFLRVLSNETRNSGKPPGDKPEATENQKMLGTFWAISSGKTPKQIAIEVGGSSNYEGAVRSLLVRMRRFSHKVHKAYCEQSGRVPESIHANVFHEQSWRYLSELFGRVLGWPGVEPGNLQHGYALCEALRRHTLAKPKDKLLRVSQRA
jgi:hypothetical protein